MCPGSLRGDSLRLMTFLRTGSEDPFGVRQEHLLSDDFVVKTYDLQIDVWPTYLDP